jgi:hypothetical protein
MLYYYYFLINIKPLDLKYYSIIIHEKQGVVFKDAAD